MDEFWRNQKGRSSWGFTFVSVTIYIYSNLLRLIRINISHCSKTGGNSTKQTHLDHWKVPKHGRLEIIFHVAKSDYGSWPKLGVISQCLYAQIFIIKTSARSLWTRRSETEEAEDVDEDGCTAKSDIVPAEPLEMGYTHCVVFVHKFVVYWIHRPREWDVYNFTTTFHPVSPVGKH